MSEFGVKVIRLGPIREHSNADRLEITDVHGGYPAIVEKGEFKEGDLAVYATVDSIFPDTEEWEWLGSKRRVKAKKLRGIFSMGLILPVPEGMEVEEGDDLQEHFGVTKYEPPEPITMGGEAEKAPEGWYFPHYTDIDGLRKYKDKLEVGEEVVVTEKVHGANGRAVHDEARLWVGSHTQIKKRDEDNLWWKVALKNDLEEKLARYPWIVLFFEAYGQVQKLRYGMDKPGEADLIAFDAFDIKQGVYLDYADYVKLVEDLELPAVPEIYRGPWLGYEEMKEYAEGKSLLADHLREGFVVRPVVERFDEQVGRMILKLVGETYQLKKKE